MVDNIRFKKVIYILLAIFCYKVSSCYSYCVKEIMAPLTNSIINNFKILMFVIMLTLVVLFFISLIIKIITGGKIITGKFLSNKFVRFIEVSLFIGLIIFFISEFIESWKKYYSIGGIIVALFAFYQRVSNKNRKFAYISLILASIIYGVFKIFCQ